MLLAHHEDRAVLINVAPAQSEHAFPGSFVEPFHGREVEPQQNLTLRAIDVLTARAGCAGIR